MKAVGTIFIVLALVIGIVPQFTNCYAQGRTLELANGRTTPMKCFFTAEAMLAVAIPMLAVGVLMIINRNKAALQSLSVLGGVQGLFAILVPTTLIGVCASDEMLCNIIMKPTLIFSGILAVVAGILGIVLLSRSQPRLFADKAGHN